MKTLITAALISASFMSTAVFAQEETEPLQSASSGLTRAQVQQELAAARATGQLFNGENEDSNAASVNRARPSSPQAGGRFKTSINGYDITPR